MKLVEMKVNEYLDVLKSSAPAPGGGSVSALAGAQGVALFMMVCDLTLGKEKYAQYQQVCAEAKENGGKIYTQLVEAIDADTEAFNLVSAALKMPKGTDEEKKARSKAIAEGTLASTEVPFKVMELAYEALLIARSLEGKSNQTAASDLGVAVLNLNACIKGAWLNVKINLPGVKDEAAVKSFEEKGMEIVEKTELIAKDLYDKILALL